MNRAVFFCVRLELPLSPCLSLYKYNCILELIVVYTIRIDSKVVALMENKRVLTLHQFPDVLLAMQNTVELAKQTGFSDEESTFLKLVTEEACVNAFENYGKKFEFRCGTDRTFFEIVLTQAGGGLFNIELNQETSINQSLRGRGLQLIRELMDEVTIDRQGERVVFSMKKQLPAGVESGDGGEREG